MIYKHLAKIGLDKKESDVYLTALRLGSQPASIIGKRLDMPRNSARFILDKLVADGLIAKSLKGTTQIYTVNPPQSILHLIDIHKNKATAKFEKQKELISEILPELEGLYQTKSTRPKVTFYEGDDGLRKVYEDTLTSKETIRSWASFDGMHGALPEYFKDYYERRQKKGIHIRSIHPDTELAREKTTNNANEERTSKLVNPDQYNFDPEIQLYDNKMVITSWKEKLGIIIESEEINKAMNVAFELAWKGASSKD